MNKAEILRTAAQQLVYSLGHGYNGEQFTERQLTALRNIFLTLNKYAPPETLVQPREVSTKNTILFALNPETSRWASIGVVDEMLQVEWQLFGFTPETASQWVKEDITPDVAKSWGRFTAKDAKSYIELGWFPHHASGWEGFSVQEATAWRDAGISVLEAKAWKEVGVKVDQADLVAKMSKWRTVKPANIRKKWGDMDIHDIFNFTLKGYTPAVAKKILAKGGKSSDLPHVRGNSAVAGKSFKHFTSRAEQSSFEWKYPATDKDLPLEEKDFVAVNFVANIDEEKIRSLKMNFTQSGRFLGAEDNVRKYVTIRSIEDVCKILDNPC